MSALDSGFFKTVWLARLSSHHSEYNDVWEKLKTTKNQSDDQFSMLLSFFIVQTV